LREKEVLEMEIRSIGKQFKLKPGEPYTIIYELNSKNVVLNLQSL